MGTWTTVKVKATIEYTCDVETALLKVFGKPLPTVLCDEYNPKYDKLIESHFEKYKKEKYFKRLILSL